ncbi:hypothetical protein [Microbacterium kunmingense]|uniref:hypothetical protein n=1 Tax=Microbacterium kunmingense TaxID=2915939 RepID=UPI0020052114|nr:hypothetical protein [Microbacterium kunmingense]
MALQALVDAAPAGATILFDRAGRYRIDPITINKALHFDLNGSTVITRTRTGSSTEAPLFGFAGSEGAFKTITASVTEGDFTVSVNSVSGLAVGDWVQIRDSTELLKWDTGAWFSTGQRFLTTIVAIGASTVTLAAPAPWGMTVSPQLVKLNVITSPRISNGTIRDTNPGNDPVTANSIYGSHADLLSFRYTVDARVDDVTVIGWQGVAAKVWDSANAEINVNGVDPFRPATSGCGHLVRFIRSTDSKVVGGESRGARHHVTHVQAVRCGSVDATAHNTYFGAFQTHGHGAVDCYSKRDTVVNERSFSSGWQFGNGQYGPDKRFRVIDPSYTGRGVAFLACAASSGMRIVAPEATVYSGRGLAVIEQATDIVLDVQTGRIEGSGELVFAGSNLDGTGTTYGGDLTIVGDGFRGAGALNIRLSGKLRAIGVSPKRISGAIVGDLSGSEIASGKAVSQLALRGFDRGAAVVTNQTWPTSNLIAFAAVTEGGRISKIALEVMVSNGNISVAVYRGAGGPGGALVPGARAATSGAVACPAVGYAEVSLGAAVDVEPGDFLALSCDNVTAVFAGLSGTASSLQAGFYYRSVSVSAHPAPNPAPSGANLTPSMNRVPLLVGVA